MRKPESEWFRVENTHEPIIDKEVFYRVQEQIKSRRRQTKEKATPIFAGLVKCADCGWSMRFATNNILTLCIATPPQSGFSLGWRRGNIEERARR